MFSRVLIRYIRSFGERMLKSTHFAFFSLFFIEFEPFFMFFCYIFEKMVDFRMSLTEISISSLKTAVATIDSQDSGLSIGESPVSNGAI